MLSKINEYIYFPASQQDLQHTKLLFYHLAHFPNVIERVAGAYIAICPPSANGFFFEIAKIVTSSI